MVTLAAAFPTNQSPAATSIGDPLREYGLTDVVTIGKRVKMARPAPSAPLTRG